MKYSKEEKQKVIDTYMTRKTVGLDTSFRVIAELVGMTHITVGNILRSSGVVFKSYVMTDEEKKEIVNDYTSGNLTSLTNLAIKYHRSLDAIKKVLVAAKVYVPRKIELIDYSMQTPAYKTKIWKSPEIVLRVPNGRGGYTSKTYYDVTYAPDDFGFPQFGCENAKEAMKNAKR